MTELGRIPDIGSSDGDRGALNIKGRNNMKKTLVISVLVVLAIVVVAGAIAMVAGRINETSASEAEFVEKEGSGDVASLTKGNSEIGDAGHFFKQAQERMQQEKDRRARAERLAEAEKAKLAREEEERARRNAQMEALSAKKYTNPSSTVAAVPVAATSQSGTPNTRQSAVPTREERQLSGSVMINSGEELASIGAGSTPDVAELVNSSLGGMGLDGSPFGGGESSERFDSSFNASEFEDGSALARSPYKRDFLLQHGSIIPCVLETEIISDYAGFTKCRVTQDVYSSTGTVLLIEKGSVVSGTQKVAMKQGQSRVFTTWADIETPEGISIRIDSLGAGPRGASGTEAWIDNHYAERFGGAILLSLLDDALATLANNIESGDVVVSNTTDNASDMASIALENSINIPPTAYVNIGERLNILVVRDIDMSSVYKLSKVQ